MDTESVVTDEDDREDCTITNTVEKFTIQMT